MSKIEKVVNEIVDAQNADPFDAEVTTDALTDALVLLKKQDEVIQALLKVGYPHNFQREEPWIRNYMYAITDVVEKAVRLNNET